MPAFVAAATVGVAGVVAAASAAGELVAVAVDIVLSGCNN